MLDFLKILEAGRVWNDLVECLGSCLSLGCQWAVSPVAPNAPHSCGAACAWAAGGAWNLCGTTQCLRGGWTDVAVFPRQPEVDQLEKDFPNPTWNNSVDAVCHLLAPLPGCLVSSWTWGLCEDILRRVLLLARAGAQGLSIEAGNLLLCQVCLDNGLSALRWL